MTLQIDPQQQRQPRMSQSLCIHHWVIDEADGAESQGRCKNCGDTRCFSNSLESDSWSALRDDTRPASIVGVREQRTTELADEL